MPVNTWTFSVTKHAEPSLPDRLELQRNGPVLRVEIGIPSLLAQFLTKRKLRVPQPVKGFALFDTGASNSCVDTDVIDQLGVNPVGVARTITAAGPSQQSLFPARLYFPRLGFSVEFTSVMGANLKQFRIMKGNLVALVGRDILSRCVLIYNGAHASYTLGF